MKQLSSKDFLPDAQTVEKLEVASDMLPERSWKASSA